MRAAIYCPGPSLRDAVYGGYDLTLAVNRAATFLAADFWCAVDMPLIVDNRAAVLGNPALATIRETYDTITRRGMTFPRVVLLDDVEAWYGVKFIRRTTPSAMLLAGYLGATELDLWGDDKTQAPDFDGHRTAETALQRHPNRWASEQRDCDAITAWLEQRGIEVRRHAPAKVAP